MKPISTKDKVLNFLKEKTIAYYKELSEPDAIAYEEFHKANPDISLTPYSFTKIYNEFEITTNEQNSLINKRDFMAQYLGCMVAFQPVTGNINTFKYAELTGITSGYVHTTLGNGQLEDAFVPRSLIVDIMEDHAKEICQMLGIPFLSVFRGYTDRTMIMSISSQCTAKGDNVDSDLWFYEDGSIKHFQNNGKWGGCKTEEINPDKIKLFLLRKGYALPWREMSVAEQMMEGWIKIIKKEEAKHENV